MNVKKSRNSQNYNIVCPVEQRTLETTRENAEDTLDNSAYQGGTGWGMYVDYVVNISIYMYNLL